MATKSTEPSPGGSTGGRDCAPATPDLLERYTRYLTGQRGVSPNTRRIYLDDLHTFLNYARTNGDCLNDMSRQLLRRYVAHLATAGKDAGKGQRQGLARVSIVRKLTALRTFYNFLVQDGWFPATPMPSAKSFPVKVEKALPSFLTQDQTVRLMNAAAAGAPNDLRDRAILELLYASGVRLTELHGMNLEDLRQDRREILVRGKGNKERWTLHGAAAAAALADYLKDGRPRLAETSEPTSPLFVNRYGDRLSRRSIEKIVRNYAARAGLKAGTHTHTLRHSFASHMLEGGADLRVIQELLGHSSVATTQIYTHITKQEARRAYLQFHPLSGENETSADLPDAPITPALASDYDRETPNAGAPRPGIERTPQ